MNIDTYLPGYKIPARYNWEMNVQMTIDHNKIKTMSLIEVFMVNAFKHIRKIHMSKLSSLGGNRTCIWSFGGSYTIHCTTRPG